MARFTLLSVLFALLLPAFLAVGLLGQATTADPLSRAMQNPNDDNTITEVMHSYAHSKDPQVISRLSELFRSISDHRLLRNFGMFMWTVVGRRDEGALPSAFVPRCHRSHEGQSEPGHPS